MQISDKNSSANLGVIKTNNNEINIYYVIRSMNEQELNNLYQESISLNNKFINEISNKIKRSVCRKTYNFDCIFK